MLFSTILPQILMRNRRRNRILGCASKNLKRSSKHAELNSTDNGVQTTTVNHTSTSGVRRSAGSEQEGRSIKLGIFKKYTKCTIALHHRDFKSIYMTTVSSITTALDFFCSSEMQSITWPQVVTTRATMSMDRSPLASTATSGARSLPLLITVPMLWELWLTCRTKRVPRTLAQWSRPAGRSSIDWKCCMDVVVSVSQSTWALVTLPYDGGNTFIRHEIY